ncbi:SLATT domain-containing protein [Actinacidiphila glaucinigra]|uniref:SLATT domain-containing protein n=1 Tax=Actinacidiphila glaucinigra TaxID=235986 RepID=UPI0037C8789B
MAILRVGSRVNLAEGKRYSTGDLHAAHLPAFLWQEDRSQALRELYRWVESFAIESINWYTEEKVAKARWSRSLRAAAVLLVGLGTVAPVVAVGMGWTHLSIWGYGLIGLGASCLAVDRVFGFSSSWMRYLATAISLNRQLLQFQASWPAVEVKINSAPTDIEEFSKAVGEIAAFVDRVAEVMESETLSWVSEFQNHVLQLESGSATSSLRAPSQ